jgi:hypothetical protein
VCVDTAAWSCRCDHVGRDNPTATLWNKYAQAGACKLHVVCDSVSNVCQVAHIGTLAGLSTSCMCAAVWLRPLWCSVGLYPLPGACT